MLAITLIFSVGCTLDFQLLSSSLNPSVNDSPLQDSAAGTATWGADGQINAIAKLSNGGTIYGGSFQNALKNFGSCIFQNSSSTPLQAGCAGIKGIYKIESDQRGGFFVAGELVLASGDSFTLGYIDSNGTFDGSLPQPSLQGDPTDFILRYDTGVLYISGNIDRIGDELRSGIGAIDVTTKQVLPWNPGLVFDNGETEISVDAMTTTNDKVILAGNFGGGGQNALASVDFIVFNKNNNNADSNFVYDVYDGNTWDGSPTKFAIYGNYILTRTGNGVVAIDKNSGNILSWNANDSYAASITDFSVDGNTLWVVGNFTEIFGVATEGIAKFDLTPLQSGSAPSITQWVTTGWDGAIDFIDNNSDSLIVWIQDGIAYLDKATATNLTFAFEGPTNDIFGMRYFNNQLHLWGDNISLASPRNNLFMIDADQNLTSWKPEPDDLVWSVATYNDRIFVSGYFSQIGSNTEMRQGFAELDSQGDATSLQLGLDNGGAPFAIQSVSDKLFVVGTFDHFGGEPRKGIAQIDLTTNTLTNWQSELMSGDVLSVGYLQGKLIVGGYNLQLPDTTKTNLVLIDVDSGIVDLNFLPKPDKWVQRIVVTDDSFFIAGGFQNISSSNTSRAGLAEFKLDSPTPTSWNPSRATTSVWYMNADNNKLTVLGQFTGLTNEYSRQYSLSDASDSAVSSPIKATKEIGGPSPPM